MRSAAISPVYLLIACILAPFLISALPAAHINHKSADIAIVPQNVATAPAPHDFVSRLVHHLRRHAIGAVLRLELFTIGSGNHFAFPALEPREDEELHRSAAALVRLWTRLSTMEVIDPIINDATVEAAHLFSGDFVDAAVVRAIFKNIEERLQKMGDLYDAYVTEQKNVGATATPSVQHKHFFNVDAYEDELRQEELVDWISQPNLKKYFVNKLFLQQCVRRTFSARNGPPEADEYAILAKTLATMAKNVTWTSTAQSIYDETVDEIAASFSALDHPYESNSRLFKNYEPEAHVDLTTPKLFATLMEKCRKNVDFFDAFQVMKRKLTGEQIGAATATATAAVRPEYVINLFPL